METNNCKDFTFNFIREKVMEKCEEYGMLEEQVKYLRCILREKRNYPEELDYNINLKPTFEDFVNEEIGYREYLLKLPESNAAGLVKIKGKISNVVRIFEGMKNAGIISSQTENSQIGAIFFREKIDINKFADSYKARKDDTIDEERTTTDKLLIDFVKDLISTSFRRRGNILNDLQSHIDNVRH